MTTTNHHYAVIRENIGAITVVQGKQRHVQSRISGYGDKVIIVGTYEHNPVDLIKRIREAVYDKYNVKCEEYIAANIGNGKTTLQLYKCFKIFSPIYLLYSTIHFDTEVFSEEEILTMIDNVVNERFNA